MKFIEKHFVEYLILFVALAVFFMLFLLFKFNRASLLILSGGGCGFYVSWGIIHHVLRGRLTRLIALEYALFGLLVFLLLFTVLNF